MIKTLWILLFFTLFPFASLYIRLKSMGLTKNKPSEEVVKSKQKKIDLNSQL